MIPRFTETVRTLTPGARLSEELGEELQKLGADIRRDHGGAKLPPIELHRDGRLIEFAAVFWKRIEIDAALKHSLDEGAITVRDLTEGEVLAIDRRDFEERRHAQLNKMHESVSQ